MRASASSLWLLEHCRWWARDEVPAGPRVSSDYQTLGTAVHAAIDLTLQGTRPVLDEITAALWDCDLTDLADAYDAWADWIEAEDLRLDDWRSEYAVAWDPATDTARELQVDGHRKYDTRPGEIPGTMDAVVRRRDDGSATILDWKIGDDWQGYTPAASENRQLALYALAIARMWRLDEVTVAVVKITSRGVIVDRHTLDVIALDAIAAQLAAQLASVPTSEPATGEHCGRCPAAVHCPAAQAETQALVERTAVVPMVIDTPEAAGALRERLAAVKAACEQADAALRAWGEGGGEIVTSDGKRLVLTPQTRREITLDGQAGAEAEGILAEYGVGHAIVQPPPRATWSGIERALKEQGLKVAPTKREIESRLAAAGAIREANHGSRWTAAKGGK